MKMYLCTVVPRLSGSSERKTRASNYILIRTPHLFWWFQMPIYLDEPAHYLWNEREREMQALWAF